MYGQLTLWKRNPGLESEEGDLLLVDFHEGLHPPDREAVVGVGGVEPAEPRHVAVQQVHQECLDVVVQVVGRGDDRDPRPLGGLVYRPAPEDPAEAAGRDVPLLLPVECLVQGEPEEFLVGDDSCARRPAAWPADLACSSASSR